MFVQFCTDLHKIINMCHMCDVSSQQIEKPKEGIRKG